MLEVKGCLFFCSIEIYKNDISRRCMWPSFYFILLFHDYFGWAGSWDSYSLIMESPACRSNQLGLNSRIEGEPLNCFHRGEICADKHLIYITISILLQKCLYQLRYGGFNNAAECEVNRHTIIKRKELLLTHLNQFWDTFWTNNIYLYKKVCSSSTNYLSVISNCIIVHKFSLCWGFSVLALFIFLRQFFFFFFRVWLSFQFT